MEDEKKIFEEIAHKLNLSEFKKNNNRNYFNADNIKNSEYLFF